MACGTRRTGVLKVLTSVNRQTAPSEVNLTKMAVTGKPSGGFVRACSGFQSVALPVAAPDGVRWRGSFLAMGARGDTRADAGNLPSARAKTGAAAFAAAPSLAAGFGHFSATYPTFGVARHTCALRAVPPEPTCREPTPRPVPDRVRQVFAICLACARAIARWSVRKCTELSRNGTALEPPPSTSEGHTRMNGRYKTWLTVRRR